MIITFCHVLKHNIWSKLAPRSDSIMAQQLAMVAYLLNLVLVFRILLRTEMVKILISLQFFSRFLSFSFVSGSSIHSSSPLDWRNQGDPIIFTFKDYSDHFDNNCDSRQARKIMIFMLIITNKIMIILIIATTVIIPIIRHGLWPWFTYSTIQLPSSSSTLR